MCSIYADKIQWIRIRGQFSRPTGITSTYSENSRINSVRNYVIEHSDNITRLSPADKTAFLEAPGFVTEVLNMDMHMKLKCRAPNSLILRSVRAGSD